MVIQPWLQPMCCHHIFHVPCWQKLTLKMQTSVQILLLPLPISISPMWRGRLELKRYVVISFNSDGNKTFSIYSPPPTITNFSKLLKWRFYHLHATWLLTLDLKLRKCPSHVKGQKWYSGLGCSQQLISSLSLTLKKVQLVYHSSSLTPFMLIT